VSSILDSLISVVSAHPGWAYTTIFLAALLEAVPVAGSFIPGSSIIIGLSAFIATGGLSLPAVLACAVGGAIIGDGAAYWTGHRAERRILAAWPLSAYPQLVARSEQFFERHGTLAVFFARFVPPVRALVPVTAGALDMPPRQFFPVNITAIFLWAPLHVAPGMLAGTAFKRWRTIAEDHPAVLVAGVIACVIIAVAIWRLSRKQK
jgi:membrane protein DedA with SNARE-associated domain